MIRRLLALLLLCLVGGAGVAAAQAVRADAAASAPPTQLWEQFPLDEGTTATPTASATPVATTPSTAATPASPSTTAASTSGGSVNGVGLLVWVLVALLALPIVALSVRGVVRRRHGAADREPQRGLRPSVAGQTGTLAPLAPAVGGRRRRREPVVEEDEHEDDGPRDLLPWNLEDTQPARADEVPERHDLFADDEPADEPELTHDHAEPEAIEDEAEAELLDDDAQLEDHDPEPVADEADLADGEPEASEPEAAEPEAGQDEPAEDVPADREPVEAEAHEALEPAGTITVEDHRDRRGEREHRAPMPSIDHEHPSRTGLAVATTYEIVWYRADERLTFALQPVDGRIDPGARRRSGSFVWNQDNDPPSSLRTAQRAHGRLRARLLREGWTAAGRGTTWFSHRFHPPENLSEPSPEDLPGDR